MSARGTEGVGGYHFLRKQKVIGSEAGLLSFCGVICTFFVCLFSRVVLSKRKFNRNLLSLHFLFSTMLYFFIAFRSRKTSRTLKDGFLS